jgi:hypothetical protein
MPIILEKMLALSGRAYGRPLYNGQTEGHQLTHIEWKLIHQKQTPNSGERTLVS